MFKNLRSIEDFLNNLQKHKTFKKVNVRFVFECFRILGKTVKLDLSARAVNKEIAKVDIIFISQIYVI